ncbi:MAG: cellulase family glycosylhydrolase [Mycobacterium sp.]|nr:cellulase family glycosylhydrolase [Mycobacterium sp.]
MNHLLRALILRAVVVLMPLAVICTYSDLSPRSVTAAVTPTAAIDDSNTTIGIADSSLYGLSPADIDKTLTQLQSIGVQNVRVLVPWGSIEPFGPTPDWTLMDNVMNAAAAHNMGVLAVVAGTPLWAGSAIPLGSAAPKPSDYASFISQVATRYGSTISAYEILNEVNSASFYQPMDPTSYTAILKAVYPVIKQINPNATVVAGALAPLMDVGGLTASAPTFVQGMYAAGAQGFFDAISIHPYDFSANNDQPLSALSQVDQVHAIMVQNGDGTKLIWATEYGWQTALDANGQASTADQTSQANFIQDMITAWRALTYTGPLYIYTTRDGTPGTDTGYGIYQADWTPKLAVAVIQQAIADAVVSNPVTSPIVALAQFIQQVVAQVQQALTSFTTALQNAITAAITAVTKALTAVFNPAAAVSTTTGAATPATAATTALLAAKTSAAELQTQVAEKSASEAGATGTAAGEKATTDGTKAVDAKAADTTAADPKTADPKATAAAATDPKTVDPTSTQPTPASAGADATKGTTGTAAGTEAGDKTGTTASEPAAETPKSDGTKADGKSDTSNSGAAQSDSTKSGASTPEASKSGSQSGAANSDVKPSGQSGAVSNPKNDASDNGKAGHEKSDGKTDSGTSSPSSGVKVGQVGGQSGTAAAAATAAGKSDSSKSVDTSSGNKHTPRAVSSEQSKSAGRASNDSAAKASSDSAGSQSHENHGS